MKNKNKSKALKKMFYELFLNIFVCFWLFSNFEDFSRAFRIFKTCPLLVVKIILLSLFVYYLRIFCGKVFQNIKDGADIDFEHICGK
jgi:hypothetical protein